MKLPTKLKLIHAWNYCDGEDKSTEFTLQYMADLAGVDYSTAVDFMFNHERTEEELDL